MLPFVPWALPERIMRPILPTTYVTDHAAQALVRGYLLSRDIPHSFIFNLNRIKYSTFCQHISSSI
jgi:hypothetical protein